MSRPNIVVIVLDDVGFAQLGCFGSDIETPAFDALARDGLRYNRFHVTALCAPTRAALLTGRNHHRVEMGSLTDFPIDVPGYTARIPPSAGTLPAVLRSNDYATMALGKWHLAPRWELSAGGPFDRWPLGLGFEQFYGFMTAETNQWTPTLVRDNTFVTPPRTPDEGYHLSADLADEAIRMMQNRKQAQPDRPFFLYLGLGAMHAPLQAPPEWIERYRGRFDDGWDAWRERVLARQQEIGVVPPGTQPTPRPPWVRPWQELGPDDRRIGARGMEVFAGFLSYTDAQIGRIVDHLREAGLLDDTVVMVLSDNGTSAEGGPDGSVNYGWVNADHVRNRAVTLERLDEMGGFRSYSHYPWAWSWAGNSPFWLWKRYTSLGGIRTPLIVHWPGIVPDPGAVRAQFCHAVDVMPTLLDIAGVEPPERLGGHDQMTLDGISFRDSITDPRAPDRRTSQYFEMIGTRSLYHEGWKATTDHVPGSLKLETERVTGSRDFDTDHWALFDLTEDFAEARDLSAEHPERVRHLVERWWAEAGRNNVLPLNDEYLRTPMDPGPLNARPTHVVYRPGADPVSEFAHPVLTGGFTMTAELTVPEGTAEGVICAIGDWNQGLAWYLLASRPVVACNLLGVVHRIDSAQPLTVGEHSIQLSYRRDAPTSTTGVMTLTDRGRELGRVAITRPLASRWQTGGPGLYVGRDGGFPVTDDYAPPFALTAALRRLTVESTGAETAGDRAADAAQALRHE